MGSVNLDGILVSPLLRICTKGGDVLHAMKQQDAGYVGFGEAYFSLVDTGAVKAWKRHMRMTINLVVPVGQVRFVFWKRDSNQFRTEEIGEDSYARITVPPGIWFGFQGLYKSQNLVLNLANIPHDPSEVERLKQTDVPYIWK
jgi:dTDP-4-dehydrorhamnose 3,5-epimerase